jgi:hypothetical protein
MCHVHLPRLDSVGAGAPEAEIEITPEMIDKIALIILRADYRVEDERDVAKEILRAVFKKSQ